MKTYMICIDLPSEITEEFVSLIPKQRKKIDDLMDKGIVLNYSLAIDRSKVWVTLLPSSENKAMDILATFPMIHFMNPEIVELAFHNSLSNELPKLIMN